MATPPIVVPILATPFGVVPLPDVEAHNPRSMNCSRRECARARRLCNPVRSATAAPMIYSSGPSSRWRSWLRQCARRGHVVRAVNDFSEDQLRSLRPEARGWFTVVQPDGGVPAANYPLTAWCGIYCVAAPEPSSTRHDAACCESMNRTSAPCLRMPPPRRCGFHSGRGTTAGVRARQMAVSPPRSPRNRAHSSREPCAGDGARGFIGPGQQGVARW